MYWHLISTSQLTHMGKMDFLQVMGNFYKAINTDRLDDIVEEQIPKVCRVGGTYWMLLARPALITSIDGVYELIVDQFDDSKLYNGALDYLFRSIMRVHSKGGA